MFKKNHCVVLFVNQMCCHPVFIFSIVGKILKGIASCNPLWGFDLAITTIIQRLHVLLTSTIRLFSWKWHLDKFILLSQERTVFSTENAQRKSTSQIS